MSFTKYKIVTSIEELKKLLEEGWLFVDRVNVQYYVIQAPAEESSTSSEEDFLEGDFADAYHEPEPIIDVKEVPSDEIKDWVKKGWEVDALYTKPPRARIVLRKEKE